MIAIQRVTMAFGSPTRVLADVKMNVGAELVDITLPVATDEDLETLISELARRVDARVRAHLRDAAADD